MARAPGPGAESIAQHGRIALAAGTAVEDEDLLAHDGSSCAVIRGTVIVLEAGCCAHPAGTGRTVSPAAFRGGVVPRGCGGRAGHVFPLLQADGRSLTVSAWIFFVIIVKKNVNTLVTPYARGWRVRRTHEAQRGRTARERRGGGSGPAGLREARGQHTDGVGRDGFELGLEEPVPGLQGQAFEQGVQGTGQGRDIGIRGICLSCMARRSLWANICLVASRSWRTVSMISFSSAAMLTAARTTMQPQGVSGESSICAASWKNPRPPHRCRGRPESAGPGHPSRSARNGAGPPGRAWPCCRRWRTGWAD